MKLRDFFIPHPQTHKKAHLLSPAAFILYIVIFLIFNFSISFVAKINPDLLGVAANLNYKEIINLVNNQRKQNGLDPLVENPKLNVAAYNKAQNMYAENYWAHYSPSGKDPWSFIMGAGYKFTYAGENLAKNFYTPPDVVAAWMASPTHRENILNSHYKDIGISVVEGNLQGQPTVLIVQEFGATKEYIADINVTKAQSINPPTNIALQIKNEASPLPIASVKQVVNSTESSFNQVSLGATKQTQIAGQKSYVFDPFIFIKNLGLSLLSLLVILILIDLYIIRRRAVVRLSSHPIPHLALLALGASILINIGRGTVL